jgi:hypothetical protein
MRARDETTPLVSSRTSAVHPRWMPAATPRNVAAIVGALMLLVTGCYTRVYGNGTGALGLISNWGFTRTTSPTVTFTLDASWINSGVRAANPTFFASPLAKAHVVRHNYGSTSFFETDDALEMTRVGLRKWTLTTTEVNYEYGFMLENEAGETLREIGASYTSDREPVLAPASTMGNCTVQFGQYRNRLIPQGNTNPALDINACWGACTETCNLPDAPAPLASLDGSQYTGGSTWGNDKISCNLGTTTSYDAGKQSFYFDGTQDALVICPYDIGPGRFPELTLEIVFMLDPTFNPDDTWGWIFGHDNGGYDRSFIICDPRFGGGVGSGIGSAYDSGQPTPSNGVWHHGLAVFRQDVPNGSYTAVDGVLSPNKATAHNSEGLSSFSIGGLAGTWPFPHTMKGWVKYFNFYDGALSEDQVEAMYVQHTPWP